MRRKHSEITDPLAIEDILRTATIGRMATVGRDGYPYITPVNFVYHGGDIYFHCAPEGEKLDNIARDSRVCFEVDIPLSYLDQPIISFLAPSLIRKPSGANYKTIKHPRCKIDALAGVLCRVCCQFAFRKLQ